WTQLEATAVEAVAEQTQITLIEQASQLLDAGRAAVDLRKQASAMIDLGAILLGEGKVSQATENLQRGLEIARQFKDRPLESDALTNLAAALAATGKMA